MQNIAINFFLVRNVRNVDNFDLKKFPKLPTTVRTTRISNSGKSSLLSIQPKCFYCIMSNPIFVSNVITVFLYSKLYCWRCRN